MTEDELQSLLRLKRYEQPEEGYFDDFLQEFQERQRSELLQTSARGLVMERVKTWFDFSQVTNRLILGAGVACAACVAVALAVQLLPEANSGQDVVSTEVLTPVNAENAEEKLMLTLKDVQIADSELVREQMIPIDFSQPVVAENPVFISDYNVF